MASASCSSWKEDDHEKHRQLEALRHVWEMQESATFHFEEMATWLSIGYVIFVAILYNTINTTTTTAQQYHYSSSRSWIPISLFLSVSVAFWVHFVRSIRRYMGISGQSDVTWMEQQRMHDLIFMDRDAETGGIRTVYPSGGTASSTHKRKRNWMLNRRRIYISAVVFSLIIYTLVGIASCLYLIRSPDHIYTVIS